MIGMDFSSFLVLLVISLVVSAILHFVCSYRVIPGWGSYFGKVVIGWIGGWLGSPVLGHWWSALSYREVYVVPAILGCAGLVVVAVDLVRTVRASKPS